MRKKLDRLLMWYQMWASPARLKYKIRCWMRGDFSMWTKYKP